MNTNSLIFRNVIICTFLILVNLQQISAQVGIGTTTPEAALDVSSSNAGVLIPRFSLASVTDTSLISNPNGGAIATGTLIFNDGAGALTTVGFYYWNGSQWAIVGAAAENRAIHYNSTDGTTNLHSGALVRLPLFSDQIFNDDLTLFTIQPDLATIQVNETGRYRITVNLFFNLDESEGLAMAIFEDDGAGNTVFPSRNSAAAVGNGDVNADLPGFPGTTVNATSNIEGASMNLSTVLEFSAGDRFFIGAVAFPFGTTNIPSNVSLVAADGSRSSVIIEKVK